MTYFRGHSRTAPLQLAAAAIAAGFLMIGALGFVPGATRHYRHLEFAGHESRAELFGMFQISVLHNVVHLGFGLTGLIMAATALGARNYLVGGGVVYLALWAYGMVVDARTDANFVPLNRADDWLHFGIGAAMVVLGTTLAGRRRRRGRRVRLR
jgi:Domain of unknown function (DUF4383)